MAKASAWSTVKASTFPGRAICSQRTRWEQRFHGRRVPRRGSNGLKHRGEAGSMNGQQSAFPRFATGELRGGLSLFVIERRS
jgi:hypothetical protein